MFLSQFDHLTRFIKRFGQRFGGEHIYTMWQDLPGMGKTVLWRCILDGQVRFYLVKRIT